MNKNRKFKNSRVNSRAQYLNLKIEMKGSVRLLKKFELKND